MADTQQPVRKSAVEGSALPAWPPHVTFAMGRNERTLVAVRLGRWTLPGLFSVFGHHDLQEEPRFDSKWLLDKPDGLTAMQPCRRSYLLL